VITEVRAPLKSWQFDFSLYASSPDNLKELRDEWQWITEPDRGDGALRVVRESGVSRDFPGRIVKGWDDAAESVQAGILANALLGTTLHVFGGPFWTTTDYKNEPFTIESPRRLWFPMLWPWAPMDSTIWADRLVWNAGLHDAWPRWTIVGPGNGLVLTNRSTGKEFSLDYELGPGESVTIDTQVPGNKTVITSGGIDLIGDTDGHMWPLQPRNNDIAITLSGADDSSSVQLDWREHFDGP
jgi:hypothetical protein